jgi:hypothetical protein
MANMNLFGNEIAPRQCEWCKAPLPAWVNRHSLKRCCSIACERALRRARAGENRLQHCPTCGVAFCRLKSQQGIIYCTPECRPAPTPKVPPPPPVRNQRSCRTCDALLPLRAPSARRYCEPCAIAAHNAVLDRARARRQKVKGSAKKARQRARLAGVFYEPGINVRKLMALAWRNGVRIRCYLCGKRMTERLLKLPPNHDRYPTHEHIVPIKKGGAHSLANTSIAHRLCNSMKSDRMPRQGDLLAASLTTVSDAQAKPTAPAARQGELL